MSIREEELALELFDVGAIKFGKFRLKLHDKNPGAPLSPIYGNLRILRSFPSIMSRTIRVMGDLRIRKNLDFEMVADVPTAGTPFAAIFSDHFWIPMVSPRLDKKQHGSGADIDGVFVVGARVLLIDDLITKAESKLDAIAVLERNGLVVRDVLVILDREQGGREELRRRGYNLHSIFRLSELLDFYLQGGKIDQQKHDEVTEYLRENK